mmetsp:Transcript_36551/g.113955  ORF Transcript_36551/g.113955 Transcript_36551/m.113955 type:complete len:659 (-) Transcript_36551:119-2095(-)
MAPALPEHHVREDNHAVSLQTLKALIEPLQGQQRLETQVGHLAFGAFELVQDPALVAEVQHAVRLREERDRASPRDLRHLEEEQAEEDGQVRRVGNAADASRGLGKLVVAHGTAHVAEHQRLAREGRQARPDGELHRLVQRRLVLAGQALWQFVHWRARLSRDVLWRRLALAAPAAALAEGLALLGRVHGEVGRQEAVRHLHGLLHLLGVPQAAQERLMVLVRDVGREDVPQVPQHGHEGQALPADELLPSFLGVALGAELRLERERRTELQPLTRLRLVKLPLQTALREVLRIFGVPLAEKLRDEVVGLRDVAGAHDALQGEHRASSTRLVLLLDAVVLLRAPRPAPAAQAGRGAPPAVGPHPLGLAVLGELVLAEVGELPGEGLAQALGQPHPLAAAGRDRGVDRDAHLCDLVHVGGKPDGVPQVLVQVLPAARELGRQGQDVAGHRAQVELRAAIQRHLEHKLPVALARKAPAEEPDAVLGGVHPRVEAGLREQAAAAHAEQGGLRVSDGADVPPRRRVHRQGPPLLLAEAELGEELGHQADVLERNGQRIRDLCDLVVERLLAMRTTLHAVDVDAALGVPLRLPAPVDERPPQTGILLLIVGWSVANHHEGLGGGRGPAELLHLVHHELVALRRVAAAGVRARPDEPREGARVV